MVQRVRCCECGYIGNESHRCYRGGQILGVFYSSDHICKICNDNVYICSEISDSYKICDRCCSEFLNDIRRIEEKYLQIGKIGFFERMRLNLIEKIAYSSAMRKWENIEQERKRFKFVKFQKRFIRRTSRLEMINKE